MSLVQDKENPKILDGQSQSLKKDIAQKVAEFSPQCPDAVDSRRQRQRESKGTAECGGVPAT
jgi:hypothetical protein